MYQNICKFYIIKLNFSFFNIVSPLDTQKQISVFLGILLMSIYKSLHGNKSSYTLYNQYKTRYSNYLSFKWTFSKLYNDSYFSCEELALYFDSFIQTKWFKPLLYNHELMRLQRRPSQGDFNWIFDDTVLALASPISDIPFNPNAPKKSG